MSASALSYASPPPAAHVPHKLLPWHVAATVLTESASAAVIGMLPFIARKQFHADDFQTMLITLAVPACQIVSIFWQRVQERVAVGRYPLMIWACAWAPLGLASFAQSYWPMLGLFFVAAIGTAGLYPLKGTLLRHLYPDAVRGRVNGVLNMTSLFGAAALAFGLGWWLNRNGEAFRIYMPIAVGVQLCGTLILVALARRSEHRARVAREAVLVPATVPVESPRAGARGSDGETAARGAGRYEARGTGGARDAGVAKHADPKRSAWHPAERIAPASVGWFSPITQMHRILRGDPMFRLYEQAFMTYGAGYMICEVLLPLLLTKKLQMNYATIANSTRVVWQVCVMLMSLPAGWLLDRIGAARISGLSFALLAFYPLTLAMAGDALMVGVASGIFGVALAGVNQGWMLGPVALAPRPEMVPQYVAIHTTLVGFRGVVFQSAGLVLYWLSDNFLWPLLAAAAFFAWGAWQMHRLHYRLVERDKAATEPGPHETVPTPDLAVTEAG